MLVHNCDPFCINYKKFGIHFKKTLIIINCFVSNNDSNLCGIIQSRLNWKKHGWEKIPKHLISMISWDRSIFLKQSTAMLLFEGKCKTKQLLLTSTLGKIRKMCSNFLKNWENFSNISGEVERYLINDHF